MNNDKLLIIVDVQSDFLMPDGKLTIKNGCNEEYRKVIGDFAKKFDGRIICTYDTHNPDDCEFKTFPEHCIIGTEGHDLIPELKGIVHIPIYKKSYSGTVVWSRLIQEFPNIAEKEIYITGVVCSICLHDIVATIVNNSKEFYNKIPKIIISKKLVDDIDDKQEEYALNRMKTLYGVTIVD